MRDGGFTLLFGIASSLRPEELRLTDLALDLDLEELRIALARLATSPGASEATVVPTAALLLVLHAGGGGGGGRGGGAPSAAFDDALLAGGGGGANMIGKAEH